MAKKIQKKLSKKVVRYQTSKDTPTTHGYVETIRAELKSMISTVSLKDKSFYKKVDSIESRFDSIDERFASLRSEFKSDIYRLESKIDDLGTNIQRVLAVVEEQNARNMAVFDQYKVMVNVTDHLNLRVCKLETKTFGISEV